MLFTASISVCAEILNLMIDKIVAAQFLGEKALASISVFTPLFSIVLFVSAIVMVGSLVCYSIEIGKLNKSRADCFFGQSLILSVGCGLIMVALFAAIKTPLLEHLSLDPEIVNFVGEFYIWFLWFAFFIPINNVLQEMVFIDGDTKVCNLSYAALLGGNIAFSVLFCQSMGLRGIALGTLVSVLLSIAVLSSHFFKKRNTLRFVWHFNLRDVRSVVRFSMAESCEFLMFALFSGLMNAYFIRNFGFRELPILSMIYEIIELSVVFNGIWMAAEPLVNVYRGEENDKGIIRTMRFAFRALLKEAVIGTVLILVFAPFVISVFHLHSGELTDTAVFAVRACAVGFLPMALVKILSNYHVHEKPALSALFIMLLVLVVPLGCAVASNELFGGRAFWVGLGLAPFVAFGAGCAILFLRYGKKDFPLLLEHMDAIKDWHTIDTKLTPGSLLRFRDRMNRLMEAKNIDKSTRYKVMLLIEELGMVVYQRNKGNTVYIEFSLVLKPDYIMLVCKDDGEILDMTDLEQSITDLRVYLINMFMTVQQDKQYLLTANYNRHVFKFEVRTP